MRTIGILALALMLTGCSEYRQYDRWNATVAPSEGPAWSYRLGPGDVVRLTVFREPNLTGEYGVGASGSLSVPLLGQVKVEGQTAAQVEQSLARRLRGDYVADPKVSVEVIRYRPFFILGEVRRAGAYPSMPRMTLLDAVAIAGGFTYRANLRKVYVRRAGSEVEEVHVIERGAIASIWVYPGDNVRIPERFF